MDFAATQRSDPSIFSDQPYGPQPSDDGKPFVYFQCCADFFSGDVDLLQDLVDGECEDVDLEEFREQCSGLDEWACGMGYADRKEDGVVLADDYYVRYHKGTYDGRECYFLVHSAVEFIWLPREE